MRKLLFLFAFFLLSCRPSPVNILLVLPDEGRMGDLRKGLELASESINSEGGINGHNVKILAGKAPDETVSAVIIGTNERERSASILKTAGVIPVININPVPWPDISFCASFSGSGNDEAEFFGEFCAFSLHASRALVINDNGKLAESFMEVFDKDGRDSLRVEISDAASDSEITKVLAALRSTPHPQAVFWASERAVPAGLSKMLNMELDGRVLFVPFCSCLSGGAGLPKTTMTTVPRFEAKETSMPVKEFRINYRNRFGSEPSSHSALGYDLMMCVKQSFEAGARSSAGIRDHLAGREIVFPLLGRLSFDKDGKLGLPFDTAAVVGGAVAPFGELEKNTLFVLQEKVLSYRYGNADGKNPRTE